MSFNKKNLIIIFGLIVLCICFISTVNAFDGEHVKVGEKVTIKGLLNPDTYTYNHIQIKRVIYLNDSDPKACWERATPDQYTIHGVISCKWPNFYDPLIISFNKPGKYTIGIIEFNDCKSHFEKSYDYIVN